MTSRIPLTVQPTTDQVAVVCLSGPLGADACTDLALELEQHMGRAARQGQRLVLDLAGVELVSAAARRTVQRATDHLVHEPVLVVAARPSVRGVLEQAHLAGIRLHETLADALASLPLTPAPEISPGTPPPGHEPALAGGVRDELSGLRVKARTSGLIGIAQGMLMARYDLPGPAAALTLLRTASRQLDVPVREIASAVVTAPPPGTAEEWFPGRATHAPPSVGAFLRAYGGDVFDRREVLAAALHEAIALSGADGAEVHFADAAQDDALFLEHHHGLGAAYRDQVALVTEPPVVCARAQRQRESVTVPDVAADPGLAAHPVGHALLAAGTHALHSTPLVTTDGHCAGTLTLHWGKPGIRLTSSRRHALDTLTTEIAAWRSWYLRTVVLDALEHLHHHHRPRSPRS
ncbi:GAF domain-containing protein [Streptomyces spinosirectus]